MLSRLALRAAAQAWKGQAPATMTVIPQRNNSDYNKYSRTLDERLKLFKEVTETYYTNPDRDHKNFPTEPPPEISPPTRMIIFPDSWWATCYNKMGVSGPYVLGLGGLLTFLSKEFIIMDFHMAEILTAGTAGFILWYKFSDKMVKYAQSLPNNVDTDWNQPLAAVKKEYADAIGHMELAIWQEDGQKYLYEVKREGIDLQLEAIYRQRLAEARTEIKKRLDYQLAKETAVKNFQHNYMTRWIIDNVVKGITPEQEKAAITQCLGDLKAIAARQ